MFVEVAVMSVGKGSSTVGGRGKASKTCTSGACAGGACVGRAFVDGAAYWGVGVIGG